MHSVPEKCRGVGVQGPYLTLPLACTADSHKLLHLAACHRLPNKDTTHAFPVTHLETSCGREVCQTVTKDLLVQTINNDFLLNLSFIFISFEVCFLCFSNTLCCSSLFGHFLFSSSLIGVICGRHFYLAHSTLSNDLSNQQKK